MKFRIATTAAYLFSSAAYSSQPLAFTATTSSSSRPTINIDRSSGGVIGGGKRVITTPRHLLMASTKPSSTEYRSSSSVVSSSSSSQFAPRRVGIVNPSTPPSTSSSSTTPNTTSSTSSTITPANNGSPLSMVIDSQREFETNLGRAVDSLKRDYPNLLTTNPNWDVYHPKIVVVDPSGVKMVGLENYKMAFDFVHGVVRWFYDEDRSKMTSVRVGYDWARKCIRVSWNVELVPKMIYGGTRNTLHVDGISEYHLDMEESSKGLITDHRITHLLINDQAVRPANGIFTALAEMAIPGPLSGIDNPEGVPVYYGGGVGGRVSASATFEFRSRGPLDDVVPFRRRSSLFSNPNENAADPADMGFSRAPYDIDALQRKNKSRQRFGKPPLTPEEFVIIEEEVRAMDAMNKKKASYLAEQLAQQSNNVRKKKKEDSFLSNIFGGVFKNGCESNFDCERPQVCCDVGFKRICCSNGLGIVDGIPVERYERGLLRVPLPNDNYDY